jgi:hypothetical protein
MQENITSLAENQIKSPMLEIDTYSNISNESSSKKEKRRKIKSPLFGE